MLSSAKNIGLWVGTALCWSSTKIEKYQNISSMYRQLLSLFKEIGIQCGLNSLEGNLSNFKLVPKRAPKWHTLWCLVIEVGGLPLSTTWIYRNPFCTGWLSLSLEEWGCPESRIKTFAIRAMKLKLIDSDGMLQNGGYRLHWPRECRDSQTRKYVRAAAVWRDVLTLWLSRLIHYSYTKQR